MKRNLKPLTLLGAIATVSTIGFFADKALAHEGGDCCYTHTIITPFLTARSAMDCMGSSCPSGMVCTGNGGVLPNGQPWAEAECVPGPGI